jgi:hypothetical protein
MAFIASYWLVWLIGFAGFGAMALGLQLRNMRNIGNIAAEAMGSMLSGDGSVEGLAKGVARGHASFVKRMLPVIICGFAASAFGIMLLISIVANLIAFSGNG